MVVPALEVDHPGKPQLDGLVTRRVISAEGLPCERHAIVEEVAQEEARIGAEAEPVVDPE